MFGKPEEISRFALQIKIYHALGGCATANPLTAQRVGKLHWI
jgi:hypothetical protein